jgi:hypothetical protein
MSLHKPGDNFHNVLGQGTVLASFLVTQYNAISPLLLGLAIKLAKSPFMMSHRKPDINATATYPRLKAFENKIPNI